MSNFPRKPLRPNKFRKLSSDPMWLIYMAYSLD